jgi:hypothetical protein
MVVMPLRLRAFYASNPQGASYFLRIAAGWKTLLARQKVPAAAIFGKRFSKGFSLDLARSDRGIVYSGNVLQ